MPRIIKPQYKQSKLNSCFDSLDVCPCGDVRLPGSTGPTGERGSRFKCIGINFSGVCGHGTPPAGDSFGEANGGYYLSLSDSAIYQWSQNDSTWTNISFPNTNEHFLCNSSGNVIYFAHYIDQNTENPAITLEEQCNLFAGDTVVDNGTLLVLLQDGTYVECPLLTGPTGPIGPPASDCHTGPTGPSGTEATKFKCIEIEFTGIVGALPPVGPCAEGDFYLQLNDSHLQMCDAMGNWQTILPDPTPFNFLDINLGQIWFAPNLGDASITLKQKCDLAEGDLVLDVLSGNLFECEGGDFLSLTGCNLAGDTGSPGFQIVGPTGVTGPTGQTAPTGGFGGFGATGATGSTGGTGATGPQGIQGPQGVQGDLGDEGLQGLAPANCNLTGPAGPSTASCMGDTYAFEVSIPVGSTPQNIPFNKSSNRFITENWTGTTIIGPAPALLEVYSDFFSPVTGIYKYSVVMVSHFTVTGGGSGNALTMVSEQVPGVLLLPSSLYEEKSYMFTPQTNFPRVEYTFRRDFMFRYNVANTKINLRVLEDSGPFAYMSVLDTSQPGNPNPIFTSMHFTICHPS